MGAPFQEKSGPAVTEGMEVRGDDEVALGRVSAVRDMGFLLYRPPIGVFLVPYSAIQSVSNQCVVLQSTGEKLAEAGCTVLEATPMPASPLGK